MSDDLPRKTVHFSTPSAEWKALTRKFISSAQTPVPGAPGCADEILALVGAR
jgi:hypothetical protein